MNLDPQRIDRIYTLLISMLNRAFGKEWHLDGETLAYFMCNYSLMGCRDIYVAHMGDLRGFDQLVTRESLGTYADNSYALPTGMVLFLRKVEGMAPVSQEFPKDYDRAKLNFPECIGGNLDRLVPGWSETTPRGEYSESENCFFTKSRKANGYDLIGKMLGCGEKAGIKDKMFLGFGNVLGYALRHDFLPHDDDIDMCILADDIPQEQRHAYLMACKDAGLTKDRMRGPVSIDGKYCWFSIGPLSPYIEDGVKSCTWFWFKHGGYYWHSKGTQWIGRAGLSKTLPTAKGIPEICFQGLKTVRFGGIEVQVPLKTGEALDAWYPRFVTRRKEASAIDTVLVMPNESDRKTWYITRNE